MNLELIGKLTDTEKEELLRAANFFGKTLLTKKRFEQVDLTILIKQNLRDKGYCEVDYEIEDFFGRRLPRCFFIEIKKEKMKEMLATLAHEMVHLKQQTKGEMRDTRDPNIVLWQGKKILLRKVDYFEHPWEIDAYGREVGLVQKYLREGRHDI
jgi:hypothetical protein